MVWLKEAGVPVCPWVERGAPGVWLEGARGVPAEEVGVGVEEAAGGVEVPGSEGGMEGSVDGSVWDKAPPRSMKRERSFLSRA